MARTDDVLTSLKVLGKLKANQKLNTRHEGYLTIEGEGWQAQVVRAFSSDSRHRMLDALDTLFTEALAFLQTHLCHKSDQAYINTG